MNTIQQHMISKGYITFKYMLWIVALSSALKSASQNETQHNNSLQKLNASIESQLNSTIEDSLSLYKNMHNALKMATKSNSNKDLVKANEHLAIWHNKNISVDSSLYYYNQILDINKTDNSTQDAAEIYLSIESIYKQRGQYLEAMKQDFKALELYEKLNNKSGIAKCFTRLCDILYYQEKYEEGVAYCQKAIDIQGRLNEPIELSTSYRYKADNLLILERYNEALESINKAIEILEDAGIEESEIAPNYNTRGNIYKYLERYDDAVLEYKKCYELATNQNFTRGIISSLGNLGHVYRLQEQYEAALPYTIEAIDVMKSTGNVQNLWENYLHAARSYEAIGNYEKALEYQRLFSEKRTERLEQIIEQLETELQIKYETAKKDETIEVQDAKIDRQRRTQLLYIGIAVLLAIVLLTMYFSLKNIRKKREALASLNKALANKQNDLEEANSKLKQSLDDLNATQAQLIHSEKMASLGELTAGIAHEIQNPLNFVNNFSEVSSELIDEMNEELKNGDIDEAKAISLDIKQNLEKINHHGKRADGIVKGMLQHSRSSTGIKEPTDINKLTDEYFRLAYHGLRAKDKSFNAHLETDFDENVKTINIVPQEIGRVILNLITNAFYAVDEKKSNSESEDFKPTVSVNTKKLKDTIEICIKDNGNGIPKDIIDKIFQPFFTTKPTGKGTGLGLSMSYDIIKAHNGKLQVDSKDKEGTTFTVSLPIT